MSKWFRILEWFVIFEENEIGHLNLLSKSYKRLKNLLMVKLEQ